MKFSTPLAAVLIAVVSVFQTSSATEEASLHLRVHAEKEAICYLSCSSGQYCENGTNYCRAPSGKECFNPATGHWLANGCDPGFKCSNGKCVYA